MASAGSFGSGTCFPSWAAYGAARQRPCWHSRWHPWCSSSSPTACSTSPPEIRGARSEAARLGMWNDLPDCCVGMMCTSAPPRPCLASGAIPPMQAVRATAGRTVHVKTAHGVESFDEVILACPARRALELLSRPSEAEAQVLGAFGRCSNRIVVHRDTSVMPGERRAWAAWNYEQAPSRALKHRAVCVHYWLNKLQPHTFS